MIYEMAEEIAKKKRKKIENLIEDYIKQNGKNFKHVDNRSRLKGMNIF